MAELLLNRVFRNNLVYFIDNDYYDATTLQPYEFPEGTEQADLIPITKMSNDLVSKFISKPIFVSTDTDWAIYTANNDQVIPLIQSKDFNIKDIVDATIFQVFGHTLPEPSQDAYAKLIHAITELAVPSYDGNLTTIKPSDHFISPMNSPIFEEKTSADTSILDSYKTFIALLYSIPWQEPYNLKFIDYKRYVTMRNHRQIAKAYFDPLNQPLAGLPESSIRVLTIVDTSGNKYLLKIRYDPINEMIYPL